MKELPAYTVCLVFVAVHTGTVLQTSLWKKHSSRYVLPYMLPSQVVQHPSYLHKVVWAAPKLVSVDSIPPLAR